MQPYINAENSGSKSDKNSTFDIFLKEDFLVTLKHCDFCIYQF